MGPKGYGASHHSLLALQLFEAVEERSLQDIWRLLDHHNADPNIIIPGKGISPFHLVIGCECSHFAEEATRTFLQHNGNPNIQNEEGLTPVHIAAVWGRTKLLLMLLSHGGDPWLRDSEKRFTPLHFALKEKHWETALVLQRYQLKDRRNRHKDVQGAPRFNMNLETVVVNAGEMQAEYATLPQDNVSPVLMSPVKPLRNSNTKCTWNIEPLETHEYVQQWCHKEFQPLPMTSTPNHHKTLNTGQVVNQQLAETTSGYNSKDACRAPNITQSKEMTPKKVDYSSNMEPTNVPSGKNASKGSNDVCKKLFLELKKRFSSPKQSLDVSKEGSSKANIFERSSGYFGRKSFMKSDKGKKIVKDKQGIKYTDSATNHCSFSGRNLGPKTSNSAGTDDSDVNVEGKIKSSLENSPIDEVDAVPLSDSVDTSVEWIASQSCFSEEPSPDTSHSQSYFTCDEGPTFDARFGVPSVRDEVHFSQNSEPVSEDQLTEAPQRPPRRKELKAIANYEAEMAPSNTQSTASFGTIISEKYRYFDEEAGVVLIEDHFLNKPVEVPSPSDSESVVSVPLTSRTDALSSASDISSVPASFCYDTVTLRKELISLGEIVGPITSTTKTVYLRRLYRLKKGNCHPSPPLTLPLYPSELERLLNSHEWETDVLTFAKYELLMCEPFENPDPKRRWREGVAKLSFNYLLLDPRLSLNLPASVTAYDLTTWRQFISSVFYIGKGKRSRPYAHLYQAVHLWKKGGQLTNVTPKMQRILDIWKEGHGVVCLHVFQNIIPVEAFTREAAMIDAIGMNNLVNLKSGEYYGPASIWRARQKKQLGIYLLYRAMRIFLCEGERQLRPGDID